MRATDVTIIGGGIIGLTTAYALAERGATVRVLERGRIGREASWAGAGIIPPGNFARAATPIDRLRAYGSERMAAFSAALAERTGIENGYRACGGIEFLSAEEYSRAGVVWTTEGIAWDDLCPAELTALEPAVRPPDCHAVYLPGLAQVRNPRHLRALQTACEQLGVEIVEQVEIVRWEGRENRLQSLESTQGIRWPIHRVLIAAGAWSGSVAEMMGLRLPIRPVLGQILLLRGSKPIVERVLLLGKEYVVPRADGRLLIGSTEEPEAGFTKRTTEEGLAHLFEWACRLIPGCVHLERETAWAGLRPGSADGFPYLGRLPTWENAFLAAGHFRAGVQLSLGTAALMRAMLLDEPIPNGLEAAWFAPTRTPHTDTAAAFRS